MGKKEVTTVKISKYTVNILNELKIHPRQPYEEVILKFVREKKSKSTLRQSANNSRKKEITTIKLTKSTVEILNRIKIHPRQSYEEVILNLISNGESKKKSKE